VRSTAFSKKAKGLALDPKTVWHYCELGAKHGVIPEAGQESLIDERVLAVVAALSSMSGRPHGASWERCVDLHGRIAGLIATGVRLTKIRNLLSPEGEHFPTRRCIATRCRSSLPEASSDGGGCRRRSGERAPGRLRALHVVREADCARTWARR
jgi:hypothetical protein